MEQGILKILQKGCILSALISLRNFFFAEELTLLYLEYVLAYTPETKNGSIPTLGQTNFKQTSSKCHKCSGNRTGDSYL